MRFSNYRFLSLLAYLLIICFSSDFTRCEWRSSDVPSCAISGLEYHQKSLQVIDSFKTSYNTYITILEDKNGDRFIVKQDTRNVLYWHLTVVRDMLGAFIAESADIPANRVDLIPAYCEFIGKRNAHLPATLHTLAPGIMVKNLPKSLRKFDVYIHQSLKKGIAKKQRGLNRLVLQGMATHPDLPKIVALDTFIANGDRHRQNFFYDPETNRYSAIDLESSFKMDLAAFACKFISSLTRDEDPILSDEEVHGLKVYRKVLKQLIKLHTPESLYECLIDFTHRSGILKRSLRSTVTAYLQLYRVSIEKNYDSCKKLIVLLDRLLDKHKEKQIRIKIVHNKIIKK